MHSKDYFSNIQIRIINLPQAKVIRIWDTQYNKTARNNYDR